ncbi:MAG: hypothetical protein U0441_07710 [Polyangiaceae bacterium]
MPFERSSLLSVTLLSALLSAPLLTAGCAKGSQGLTGGSGAASEGAGGAGASGASQPSGGTTTTTTTPTDTGDTTTTTTSSTSDTTTSGTTSSSSTTTTSSSTTTTTTVTGNGCPLNQVLISEVRTRGLAGGSDEFLELYNASSSAVVLDDTWKIEGRKAGGASYSTRWTGASQSVPAWGHFLIVGQSYAQSPAGDATFSSGISDATSVRLVNGGGTQDALCFYFDAASELAYDATYTCEGAPAPNLPHDDSVSAASNADVSLQRLPAAGSPSCQDTNDNLVDFTTVTPADPQNTSSPPTP